MSVIPHPPWCSLKRCSATDVDGEGAHQSRPSEFRGTGSFPARVVTDLYRVDSAEFGRPLIGMKVTGVRLGEIELTVADVRQLGGLLLDLADEADAAERGATS